MILANRSPFMGSAERISVLFREVPSGFFPVAPILKIPQLYAEFFEALPNNGLAHIIHLRDLVHAFLLVESTKLSLVRMKSAPAAARTSRNA